MSEELTDAQAAALNDWRQSQDKAEQARKLTEEAAHDAREAVTTLSKVAQLVPTTGR